MLVRQKHNIKLLIAGIFGFVILAFYANKFSPDSPGIISIFLTIFFFSGFLISLYLLNNVRRAILISLGLSIWLALRAAGLREPFYPALLAASLLSIEFLFSRTR